MLGLEHQGHLGDDKGDVVAAAPNQLAVGQGDRIVAPAHPAVTRMRLTEAIQPVASGHGFPQPGLKVAGQVFRIRPDPTAPTTYRHGARVISPTKRSSAQPAATHHGALTAQSLCATSAGDQASQRVPIASSGNSPPPSLTQSPPSAETGNAAYPPSRTKPHFLSLNRSSTVSAILQLGRCTRAHHARTSFG
jgi:hypothetical protein